MASQIVRRSASSVAGVVASSVSPFAGENAVVDARAQSAVVDDEKHSSQTGKQTCPEDVIVQNYVTEEDFVMVANEFFETDGNGKEPCTSKVNEKDDSDVVEAVSQYMTRCHFGPKEAEDCIDLTEKVTEQLVVTADPEYEDVDVVIAREKTIKKNWDCSSFKR